MKDVAVKCSKSILAILMLTNVSLAQDFNGIAEDLNSSTTIIEDSRLKLEVELMFKESVLLSMDQINEFNQALGFDSEYGHITAIPVLAAGLAITYLTLPVVNGAINYVTPSNVKMLAYLNEYKVLKQNVLTARAEYNDAVKRNKLAVSINNDAVRNQTILEMDIKNRNLSHAIVQQASHLKTRPGALYGMGRAVRGLAKTTLFLGSATIGLGVIGDVAMLWLPEETDLFYNQLKSDVEQLNQVLYPNAQF